LAISLGDICMPDAGKPRFLTPGRVGLLFTLVAAIAFFFLSGWYQQFTFESLKERRDWLKGYVEEHLALAVVIYFGVYLAVAGLSLPFSTPVSLIGGFLFGFWLGVVLVSFASTTGSLLAFLGSRYLFRDVVQRRLGTWIDAGNRGLDKDGLYYLLTLRLIPLVPFFVVNLVMGLSRMPARTFWWVSQLGMLPATCIYVNAGKQLGSIESPRDILTARLLVSLVLVGAAPLVFRWMVNWWRGNRTA
jgi:uncharacterized membrane protein YdjX (TVP38/TMEM64 family)